MRKIGLCKDCKYFKQLSITLWGEKLYKCIGDLPNQEFVELAKKSRDITAENIGEGLFRARRKIEYEEQGIPNFCVLKMEYLVLRQDEKFRNM